MYHSNHGFQNFLVSYQSLLMSYVKRSWMNKITAMRSKHSGTLSRIHFILKFPMLLLLIKRVLFYILLTLLLTICIWMINWYKPNTNKWKIWSFERLKSEKKTTLTVTVEVWISYSQLMPKSPTERAPSDLNEQ